MNNETQLADVTEQAINRLISRINHYRLGDSYATYAKNSLLLKELLQLLDELKAAQGKILNKILISNATSAIAEAEEDLQRLGGSEPDRAVLNRLNKEYIQAAFTENYGRIAGLTNNMAEDVKAFLQGEMAQISRRASMEGLSRKSTYALLRDTIQAKMPKFQFIDRRGRIWSTKDYLNMLTRTVMADTQRAAYTNTLVAGGYDLVKVSSHNAKDKCREWEGKVLSLTGKTPGYPTVEEAKATNEVFHPRCRHRLLFFSED